MPTGAVKSPRDGLSAHRWPLQTHFALLIAAFVSVAAAVAVYVHVQAGRDARSAGATNSTETVAQ